MSHEEDCAPADSARAACLRVILVMAGIRPTRQRLLLADRIVDRQRHFTVAMLHAECVGSDQLPSLATAYNTLAQFESVGLVRSLTCSGAQAVYDSNTRAHHHFLLEETGEIFDVPDSLIEVSMGPPPPSGYTFQRLEVIIRLKRGPDKIGG